MPKKISCELFKTRAAEKHGSIYDYSKIDFIKNARSKVKIICGVHGEFEQIVKVHLKGHGCQKCGGRFVDSVRFYKKVKEIHKDRYDYSESVFTGQDNHIDIICRVHGKFTQLASNHLKGSGCRECSKSIMGAKKHTHNLTLLKKRNWPMEIVMNMNFQYTRGRRTQSRLFANCTESLSRKHIVIYKVMDVRIARVLLEQLKDSLKKQNVYMAKDSHMKKLITKTVCQTSP